MDDVPTIKFNISPKSSKHKQDKQIFLPKKIYRILFIAAFVFIFIVILLLNQLLRSNEQNTQTPSVLPLKITSVSPLNNPSQVYLPIQQVEFQFNQPITPDGLKFSVEPPTPVIIRYKEGTNNTLIISAENIWQNGITVIKILPETTSENGEKLNTLYPYTLNTKLPENPVDARGL